MGMNQRVLPALLFVLVWAAGLVQSRDVWFGSTPAASDMIRLFTNPQDWPQAHALVSTYVLYSQQLIPNCPWAACGPNNLSQWQRTGALKGLAATGLRSAVEAGVIKDWSCDGQGAWSYIQTSINGLLSAGAELPAFINMDEPLFAAFDPSCGRMSMAAAASIVAEWVGRVNSAWPSIGVGEIEPWPALPADTIASWIDLLKRSAPSLTHFHLDVDWNAVQNKKIKNSAAEIGKIRQAASRAGLTFGIIINGAGYPAPKTNQAYFNFAMKWIDTYLLGQGCLRPDDRVIWQSWEDRTPLNLPEDQPATHTNLILVGSRKIR